MNRGEMTEEEARARQERGMADPAVQAILTDPVMRQVLRDMQEDPAAAQRHLAHPEIAKKLEKLVAAGIVQMR
jgi:stress-induced-phosphoprotein 1